MFKALTAALFVGVVASSCSAADDASVTSDADAGNDERGDAASGGSKRLDAGSSLDAMNDGAADGEKDAGGDAHAKTDGGVGVPYDAGVCTTLSNTAPDVNITAVTGALPTGTGGAPNTGTYFLTSFLAFPGSDLGGATASITLLLSDDGEGPRFQLNGRISAVGSATQAGTLSFSGNQITLGDTCPDTSPSTEQYSYDSSAKQLSLIDAFSHTVQVFTLQ